MHVDGEATGFSFRPSACIPVSHVRIGVQLDQLGCVFWPDRRQDQPVGRYVHDEQYGAFRATGAARGAARQALQVLVAVGSLM